MNSPPDVHPTMEGGVNDQTETGTEINGADAVKCLETSHERVNGDVKSTEGGEKGTRAEKEILIIIDVGEEVRTKTTSGMNLTEKKIDRRQGITAVMKVKRKVVKEINSCIKGKCWTLLLHHFL